MERLTIWIEQNPVISTWITVISLIGVLTSVIALMIQIMDKKCRAIFYTIDSNILVDNEVSQIKGIKVFFYEEEVKTIVISSIKIWNGGNELLESSDFYPEKDLKVVIPENEKILATTVVDETEDTCKIDIKIQEDMPNEAILSFFCLEPKQGATLNVYHTNVKEEKTKVIGKLKGGKLVNKSFEIGTEDGEMYISNGKYKLYFDGGIFGFGIPVLKLFPNILGISIKKDKKNKNSF